MPTCPLGHDSVATDYCDECGAPIGGRSAGAAATSAATLAASGAAPSVPSQGGACPECGAPRTGRFCETCGHDFRAVPASDEATSLDLVPAADPWQATDPALPVVPAAAVADTPDAATAGGTSGLGSGVPSGGTGASCGTGASGPPTSTPDAGLPRRATPTGWRIVVAADREYYERIRAANPDAEPIPFPVFCPERRFVLPDRQMVIGRRSRSRGIEPEIDLTGPPEDAAVSHAHALLITVPEGWAVVDLDSANGTYVNDGPDPIEANVPVPVGDGDRIHVGAWTTLTLHADS